MRPESVLWNLSMAFSKAPRISEEKVIANNDIADFEF
jgi:hypothetical protein